MTAEYVYYSMQIWEVLFVVWKSEWPLKTERKNPKIHEDQENWPLLVMGRRISFDFFPPML